MKNRRSEKKNLFFRSIEEMESPYRIRKTWAQKEGEYTNAFKYFDKDGDGCISVKQLEEVC